MGKFAIFATAMILASAALAPALAGPDQVDIIRSQCKAKKVMNDAGCDCLAEKSASLSEGQQEMLAATATDDKKTADRLRSEMSFQELAEAGMFLADAGYSCSKAK